MRRVAGFLGLAFSSTLLQPTTLGEPWAGNSSRGLPFAGIAAENRDLWRADLTALEGHYISRFFPFVLEDYGYDRVQPARSWLWPVAREDPLTYLANRAFSRYL